MGASRDGRMASGMTNVVFSYADPTAPRLQRSLIRAVEAATGQDALKRLYLGYRERPGPESFWQSAVRLLARDVRYELSTLQAVPRDGPVVVVSNHPCGVLDGVVLSCLVEKVRPDFRVLAHALLLQAPETRTNLLPVDFSGSRQALETNLNSRNAARRHLEAGGCVIVFPAGGISTTPDRLGRRPAVDAPWQPFTAQLVQRTGAAVVPVHFAGQNSRLFQIASHVSLTLRLSLIFREVKNRIGTVLPVAIGAPIPYEDLTGVRDRQGLADELKRRTYALQAELPAIGDGHRAHLPFSLRRLKTRRAA